MSAIFSHKDTNKDWEGIEGLWEGFIENYKAYKENKMRIEDEDKFRLLSIPGPSQYRAFSRLFDLFKDGEKIVEKYSGDLDTYDLVDTEQLTARPMMKFLDDLCHSADYGTKNQNVVMASGSFWEQNPKTRQKAISYFEELHGKGSRVSIFARAGKKVEGIKGIIPQIIGNSRFGLGKRIPIHFIKARDIMKLEFPHTESCLFRLTMLLDFEKLEPDLKNGKKEELAVFFDGLINEAL